MDKAAASSSSRVHIVPIRKRGDVIAYQLRVDGGGPGRSQYFSAAKHGGADRSLRAAHDLIRDLGLPAASRPRGGSTVGRPSRLSKTKAPGVRFVWTTGATAPVLGVVATWTDRNGVCRHTSYSVETNGLEGALDRAIAARTSNGAPAADRAELLALLCMSYRAGPP